MSSSSSGGSGVVTVPRLDGGVETWRAAARIYLPTLHTKDLDAFNSAEEVARVMIGTFSFIQADERVCQSFII